MPTDDYSVTSSLLPGRTARTYFPGPPELFWDQDFSEAVDIQVLFPLLWRDAANVRA